MPVLAAILITLFILFGAGGWTSFWAVILFFLLLFLLVCPLALLGVPILGGWLFVRAAKFLKELLKHLFRPPDR